MIRTPFVRTGIPGGSSPLFRPAIYLLLTLAFYAALSAADRIWEIPHPHLFVIRLRRFTDAMLLALPVWFLHKKRWVLLWIALADLYLLSNVWYYRNYGNVMPLPSYLMVRNLDGLGPSIRSSIRLRDLWIVLSSVCFAVCYPFLSRYDSKGGGSGSASCGARAACCSSPPSSRCRTATTATVSAIPGPVSGTSSW